MENYWDIRASLGTSYNGEVFYTITPLPYYFKRREIVKELLSKHISYDDMVLDFGCGDGYYTSFVNSTYFKSDGAFKQGSVQGFDISPNMITNAIERYSDCSFYTSNEIKNIPDYFSVIFSIAVFAHINDDELLSLLDYLKSRLLKGGKIILFEQVGGYRYGNSSFTRRTISEYIKLLISLGFTVIDSKLVYFKYHSFFERYVAKIFYCLFSGSDYEKRLKANKNFLFRWLSKFFLFFDARPVIDNPKSSFGNLFIVVELL